MDLGSITPEPGALRALSHPVRLRILGLLRADGPSTATALAGRLGLNSGATSYHLRQLAQHGFVADDPARGNARERWWRAAHQMTRTERGTDSTEGREAVDAFAQAIAVVQTEQLQRAVEELPLLPRSWHETAVMSDWILRLTVGRAAELTRALESLVEGWEEQTEDPDAVDFVVVVNAFPRPGTVPPEDAG